MLAYEQTDVMDCEKGLGSSAWCSILFDGECVLGLCSGGVPTIGWGVRQIYLLEVKGINSYRNKVFFQIFMNC